MRRGSEKKVSLERPVSSHPSTYQINKPLTGGYLTLMYGNMLSYHMLLLFYNNEVYKYPDYLHMALVGGETKKTFTIAAVYTISGCIERELYGETTKESLWHKTALCMFCCQCVRKNGVGVGDCSHQSLFVNM